ncbi:hypothetical protein OUZ56_026859 [Daphnia magna]|uniref:Uncharacterized protein n=1 Tax=Daphnia magna TaxID=35525 RepID=A0ABQ9ZPE6_9CRUS|nr:hypothetical protein OUZ56_026859 [Daphnia magna]
MSSCGFKEKENGSEIMFLLFKSEENGCVNMGAIVVMFCCFPAVGGPCNPYITRRESHTITRDWENTQFVTLDVPIWAFSRMLWYFRCAILYPDWSATRKM